MAEKYSGVCLGQPGNYRKEGADADGIITFMFRVGWISNPDR